MNELKPCPFCGCNMHIEEGVYPNGEPKLRPFGWHDEDCPLEAVTFHTYPEDGWTIEILTERWNRRANKET